MTLNMNDIPCACRSVKFDDERARGMTATDIRRIWPRFDGQCDCGFTGIAYYSMEHMVAGDW